MVGQVGAAISFSDKSRVQPDWLVGGGGGSWLRVAQSEQHSALALASPSESREAKEIQVNERAS